MDSPITKINGARHEGHRENRLPLPGRTLLITNVVSAALALLVEGRALFADEPEVEYLPRCEPRGAIVKEPAIPSVTVETIHLLFQAIEAILSPQSH